MHRFLRLLALATVGILGGVACASVPAPVDRLEAARQAIAAAERSGAYEDAPLDLYVARERIERAKQAMIDEDFVMARRLADDAEVHAELAVAKAQGAQNERAAEELRAEVQAIEGDLDRRLRQ